MKKHIGKEINNRDVFIEMALICKELNSKMDNTKKITRIDFIINWLKNLINFPPSLDEKINLKKNLSIKLQELKSKK